MTEASILWCIFILQIMNFFIIGFFVLWPACSMAVENRGKKNTGVTWRNGLPHLDKDSIPPPPVKKQAGPAKAPDELWMLWVPAINDWLTRYDVQNDFFVFAAFMNKQVAEDNADRIRLLDKMDCVPVRVK